MTTTVENKPMTKEEKAEYLAGLRSQFPILQQKVNGYPLVYFDNGATSQKPQRVLDAITRYYSEYNANIHRGVHHLSQIATSAYEAARETVKEFINAGSHTEIIFTSGTTAGINLVAQTWARTNLKSGDEIVITAMEHHANIVPWQMVCEQTGAKLKVIPMDLNGEVILGEAEKIIGVNTGLVAVSHVSNALGTINPVKELTALARKAGALVLLDGAQAVPHFNVDVQALDCDFYVFSAHKMFGPTGVGILYGKAEILEQMPPYQGGGDMIKTVTFEKTTYNDIPLRFEAGTPNIEGGIAMAEAIRFMNELDHEAVEEYENELLDYATESLLKVEGVKIVGESKNKVPVVSFIVEGMHPYDIGFIMDKHGIALRTGHHCAQPVMDFFCIPGTLRVSLAFYNTKEEIDKMIEALKTAKRMLS